MGVDVHAIGDKLAPVEARYDVVVVGAGTAGTAAAIAAAKAGQSVLLVDENPVPGGLIGNDVPLFFGGRATPAVQNSARMIEQLFASNPALETAFEAGVDVRLGTCAWGLYRNGPAMRALPEPMLGLADATRAWMVGYGRLVLATGARDLVLGFPGWNAPGVMGAQALHMLLTRYDALASRRVLILGSGALGLETALLAVARGLEVAGIVEALDAVQGPPALATAVRAAGIEIFTAATIIVTSNSIDGITGATLDNGKTIACDTICLAIAVIPATELLIASGANVDNSIDLVGDCAHPAPEMHIISAWADALSRHTTPETIVCQCEEVTRADLIGVQPPQYLARPPAMAARSLGTLVADGPAHPDQIKRLTRAGMGPCQGRRCREQVACILAAASGVPVSQLPTASYRAPVRPIPLAIIAAGDESDAMAAGWDVWFGIPTQWTPYQDIGTPREAEHASGNMHI